MAPCLGGKLFLLRSAYFIEIFLEDRLDGGGGIYAANYLRILFDI
jgi:hypothetical protein